MNKGASGLETVCCVTPPVLVEHMGTMRGTTEPTHLLHFRTLRPSTEPRLVPVRPDTLTSRLNPEGRDCNVARVRYKETQFAAHKKFKSVPSDTRVILSLDPFPWQLPHYPAEGIQPVSIPVPRCVSDRDRDRLTLSPSTQLSTKLTILSSPTNTSHPPSANQPIYTPQPKQTTKKTHQNNSTQ
jgi:hypothetical protein